jgi:hypothetical protein
MVASQPYSFTYHTSWWLEYLAFPHTCFEPRADPNPDSEPTFLELPWVDEAQEAVTVTATVTVTE